MDPITQQTVLAAAGAAGGDKVYVDDVFSTFLYDGNGSTQSINNGIDLAGEGGLVWFKKRNAATYGGLWDTERGVTKRLRPDNSDAESTVSNLVTSFNSNGVSISATGGTQINNNNDDYVSWTFRKQKGFFDAINFSGNSTAGRTVAHNLGSVPGMIAIKCTSAQDDWTVYHRSIGATKNLRLNATDTARTETNKFNDTEPTSTHFSLGNSSLVNGSGATYVAYVFAHDDASFGTDGDESIIKCGTYTGNSGSQAIDLGFEPQWVMVKNTSSADRDWMIFDVMRNVGSKSSSTTSSPDQSYLRANVDTAETTDLRFYVNNTGFELVVETQGNVNYSGDNYIYMAIRRPNKPPEAGTEVFAIDTRGGTSPTPPTFNSGFPVDLSLRRDTTTDNWQTRSRLTGEAGRLFIDTSAAESSNDSSTVTFDRMDGTGTNTGVDSATYSLMFKRASGFMDVVAYSGNSSNQNINHNLEVAPEFYIVKRRSGSEDWATYAASLGANKYTKLNQDAATSTNTTIWNDTSPTSSVFTVGNDVSVNGSGDTYIAYLFATLPGISKIGIFSGTGNDINVDCGFTAGARFVLIKRTDSTGDWYVWDTTRGIVSGDDPYLLFNSDAAQVTNTDYIDPLNAGFTVTASAPAALNASGGTYLFLAIA